MALEVQGYKMTTIEEQNTMWSIQRIARKVDDFTLRDYFASKALAGIMSNVKADFGDDPLGTISKLCYAYADAMLDYRKR